MEHNLDRETEDFSLEVTSFGLTEPLQLHRQYVKNTGRNLKIRLTDDTQVRGKLIKVADDFIHLEKILTKKQKKEGAEKELKINFKDITQAKIEISFK